jgi:hypothetical protein
MSNEQGVWRSFGSLFAEGWSSKEIQSLASSRLVKTSHYSVGEGLSSTRLFIPYDADLQELMNAASFVTSRKGSSDETPDFDTVAS